MAHIVWLASYPKSGNTWLRAVYTALSTHSAPDINTLDSSEISSSRWLFDRALGVRSSDLTAEETDLLRARVDELSAEQSASDRWRKIHDALRAPGADGPIVSRTATRMALYLLRDPRDVAVSLARQTGRDLAWAVRHLGDSQASLESGPSSLPAQFRQYLGSWSYHVKSWTEQTWFPVHVLRYEDCVSDPVGTFGAAFSAAGLGAAQDEIAEAVGRCSWRRLRAQEDETGFRENEYKGRPFFRRGIAGGWVDELGSELAAQVAADHHEVMARFGYAI